MQEKVREAEVREVFDLGVFSGHEFRLDGRLSPWNELSLYLQATPAGGPEMLGGKPWASVASFNALPAETWGAISAAVKRFLAKAPSAASI